MKNAQNDFLPDWDNAKVAAIAKHYDEQTDDDVVAEIEAASDDPETVMVQVPRDLLPQVLQLVSARKKPA